MTRQLFRLSMLLVALLICGAPALAVELPTRKAGAVGAENDAGGIADA